MFPKSKIIQWALYAGIPAILFYIISVSILLFGWDFNLIEILRDPAQQSGQSSFIGFVSNIGIWLWVSATAICFFSTLSNSALLRQKEKTFLLLLGFLSMMLAVDDFFLIHDRYINEYICYFFYACLTITLLGRYYQEIVKIDLISFVLAGGLLALSILTDIFQDYLLLEYSYIQFFEEGFKFVGSATWLYFCSSVASFAWKIVLKRQ